MPKQYFQNHLYSASHEICKPMTYYNDVIWYKTHSINPNITKYHLVLLTCSGIYVKMDLVFKELKRNKRSN